jgi:hypothetical protein
LESGKTSAMPPESESNISVPEMADLLAYLKKMQIGILINYRINKINFNGYAELNK